MHVVNKNTGETYLFDDENAILYLLDVGTVPSEFTTSKSVDQLGETVTGQTLGRREWQLIGYLTAASDSEMREKRRKTSRFFNPLHVFELLCEDRKICFRLSSSAEYEDDYRTDTSRLVRFALSAFSPRPYFEAISPTVTPIARWIPKFRLPFSFPVVFGERERSVITPLYNPGDFTCGLKVVFTASSSVRNPGILDVNDPARFFRFDSFTLEPGDIVEVDGSAKTVLLTRESVTSDIFNQIDMQSVFPTLSPGDNLVRYTADSNLDGVNATVEYTPLYLDDGGNK